MHASPTRHSSISLAALALALIFAISVQADSSCDDKTTYISLNTYDKNKDYVGPWLVKESNLFDSKLLDYCSGSEWGSQMVPAYESSTFFIGNNGPAVETNFVIQYSILKPIGPDYNTLEDSVCRLTVLQNVTVSGSYSWDANLSNIDDEEGQTCEESRVKLAWEQTQPGDKDDGMTLYLWFEDINIDDVVMADAESIEGGQEDDLFAPALEEAAASDVTADFPIPDQSISGAARLNVFNGCALLVLGAVLLF